MHVCSGSRAPEFQHVQQLSENTTITYVMAKKTKKKVIVAFHESCCTCCTWCEAHVDVFHDADAATNVKGMCML